MNNQILELYKTIGNYNVIVSYQGVVSNDMIMYLASVIEHKSTLSPRMKRVFAVFLEMAQNIMRYSSETEDLEGSSNEIGKGKIMVTDHGDSFVVSAANAVSVQDGESIVKQIDYINTLSKTEQKEYFLERRKQESPKGSKGAGLGLIEMARKSDAPLTYSFLSHDKPGFTNLLLVATLHKQP